MTHSKKLLLETLAGHFALLEEAYPRKAATRTAKRAKRAVLATLRPRHHAKLLAA